MPTFLFRLFHLLLPVIVTPVSIVLPSIFLHLLPGSVASSVLLYTVHRLAHVFHRASCTCCLAVTGHADPLVQQPAACAVVLSVDRLTHFHSELHVSMWTGWPTSTASSTCRGGQVYLLPHPAVRVDVGVLLSGQVDPLPQRAALVGVDRLTHFPHTPAVPTAARNSVQTAATPSVVLFVRSAHGASIVFNLPAN